MRDITLNGTPVGTTEYNITSKFINNLTPNETYFFNVVVMDSSENKSIYNTLTIKTPEKIQTEEDIIPPTPGNNGLLSINQISSYSYEVKWSEATDNITNKEELKYLLFYSTNPGLNDLSGIVNNGAPLDEFKANIASVSLKDLIPGTKYYVNVIVSDNANNKNIYSIASFTIPMASLSLSITLKTIENIPINLSNENNLEVNITDDLIIKSNETFDKYQWFLNGYLMTTSSEITIEPDVIGLIPGTHYLTVIVEINQLLYSKTTTFTVRN